MILLLLAPVAAHAAWIVLKAQSLWRSANYQHFPLVVAGSVVLAIPACRRLGGLEPGDRRASRALVGLALVVLAGACALTSPWLGVVAAMVTLLAAVHAAGGTRLVVALMPAWAFLWLAMPLPMALDRRLMLGLQDLAARGASGLLDVLGVLHILKGNSIGVAGHLLMIEEACSGARSLFAVLTCTLFFVIRGRRTVARAVALLAAAAGWDLLANVARIAAVAVGYTRWGVDLGRGPAHEAIGGLSFALAIGLTYSTDALLAALGEPGRGIRPRPEDLGATRLPDLRRTWLSSRAVAAAFGVLALVQFGLVGPALAAAVAGAGEDAGPPARFAGLDAGSLPTALGPFKLLDFKAEARGPGGLMADLSWTWRYDFRGRAVVVSVDAPMMGWHGLDECYRGIGWVRDGPIRRELGPEDGVSGGPAFEARFDHVSPGRHGYLVYRVFDREGRALGPGLSGQLGRRASSSWCRLTGRGGGPGEGRAAGYQFQVFAEGDEPLTVGDRGQVRALFERLGSVLPLSGTAEKEVGR